MRPEAGAAAALVRARLTHQVPVGLTSRGGDALAIVERGPLPPGRRIFVPGVLPCGECPACRRALCIACTAARRIVAHVDVNVRTVEIPERFVVPIDDGDLPPARAIAAGLVSDLIGAGGRAGLGPGDTAIWIGAHPWVRVGSSWSISRGCRTFLLSSSLPSLSSTPDGAAAPPRAVPLPAGDGPPRWNALVGDAEAAGGPAGGRPERRIFVCADGPESARSAVALATPGSTLSFLFGAPPVISGLDVAPPLRVFTRGGGHPDLIAEALAALTRHEVEVEGAFAPVSLAQLEQETALFRAELERPIPFVAFDEPA